jgi:hypothetical protein
MDPKLRQAIQQELTEQETLIRLAPTNTMNCGVDSHVIALFQQGVTHVTDE